MGWVVLWFVAGGFAVEQVVEVCGWFGEVAGVGFVDAVEVGSEVEG